MYLTYKSYATQIKQLEGEQRSMHFLISTDAIDRDNDILDPKGWQLDNYKANPIVAFAHDYKSLPIAKCTDIKQTSKGLEATAEFPPKGVHPFADTVYDMLKAGFLNATSVGFRPIDFEQASDRKGYNFKTAELTEFSIVPIPSNPQALVQQRAISSDQLKVWTKDIKDWVAKAEEATFPPAQQAIFNYAAKTGRTLDQTLEQFEAFEKDYLVESDNGTKTLSDARIGKLCALHGIKEPDSTKADSGKDANLKAAHASAMDAYANAHHAETVLNDLCNAGDEMKALSGGHMSKAKEAAGAIGRAKGHAMEAAQMLAAGHGEAVPKWTDAEIQKHLDDAKQKAEQKEAPFFVLTDNPDSIEITDDVMKDVMASLGPEFATLIAGQTKATLNQMLGRID